MGIYRGLAPLKAYRGDMQPVNVYRGSTKVAGWHSASYSGTSPLTVACDYNVPPDTLVIDGRCVQTGTPSPDSPAPISTITGDVTITGADVAASDTVTVAFGSAVCASLPDGTHDSYDAVTGVLTKRVGKKTLVSTDDWWVRTNVSVTGGILFANGSAKSNEFPYNGPCCCDRLVGITSSSANALGTIRLVDTKGYGENVIMPTSLTPDVSALKTWLAANPVTVYYKLYTPTKVRLVPHLPVVRTGIKTLSVGADVVPTLSATVKSMD